MTSFSDGILRNLLFWRFSLSHSFSLYVNTSLDRLTCSPSDTVKDIADPLLCVRECVRVCGSELKEPSRSSSASDPTKQTLIVNINFVDLRGRGGGGRGRVFKISYKTFLSNSVFNFCHFEKCLAKSDHNV